MIRSKTFIATPPGFTIKEQLEDRFLTQKEFALRMEMSEKHISKLINGDVMLTTDMAMRLEMVLGISAQVWLNLEAIYREKIAKVEAENNMDQDTVIASKFPYNQMANFDWVPKTQNKFEKVFNLRKFFELNRLGILEEKLNLNVLFRRIGENEKSDYALMAWAQKAKLESRKNKTSPINLNNLSDSILQFRMMTSEDPDIFCDKLVEILASHGISLVFLPHIGGSFLHGATFYSGDKIVLGLTVRGKDADRFWFSFFHELGHIVLGHIGKDYYDEMEEEANVFAQDTLIPRQEYNDFVSLRKFTELEIISFSKKIGVDTGIIVGRLQKEGHISYAEHNNLKTKYVLIN